MREAIVAPIEAPTTTEAGGRPRPSWWAPTLAGVVVLAFALRVVDLGSRPMHHDESLDAWFSWRLLNREPYQYDPVYHGPLRFYLTAGLFRVLGEGEATARLLAALCGTGLVALAGATRRWLGDIGSLAAAALLAISPSMLYFSRFGREDLPFALLELALLVLVLSWLTAPRRWHPPVTGAVLAAAFATKETSFIVVAVLGLYLGLLVLVDLLDRRGGQGGGPTTGVLTALLAPGRRALVAGLAAFAFTFSMLFSVGFTDLGGIGDGAFEGLRYWLSQQPVNRGSQPWPFYLALLAGYEWPIVALALAGIVVAARRLDPGRGLIVWTAIANLAIYSWASERFPWLVVHPLVPLVLLAGIGAQGIWTASRRRGVARLPLLVGAVAVIGALTVIAVPVVYRNPTDPRQLLVAVQTGPDVPAIRAQVEARFLLAPDDRPPKVVVDTGASATWPWGWYLRDHTVGWVDLAADPEAARGADVVLALAANVPALPTPPGGWQARPYAHRVWWVPPWASAGAGDWFGWVTARRTFGPLGAVDAVLLEAPQGW